MGNAFVILENFIKEVDQLIEDRAEANSKLRNMSKVEEDYAIKEYIHNKKKKMTYHSHEDEDIPVVSYKDEDCGNEDFGLVSIVSPSSKG